MANHRKPKVCTVFTLANHSVKQIGAAGLKRGKTCARIQKSVILLQMVLFFPWPQFLERWRQDGGDAQEINHYPAKK